MGYNTIFTGQLDFNRPLDRTELIYLNSLFGEDCRDHPEWGEKHLSYIDLRLTEDFSGVEWDDGVEKTYDLDLIVGLVQRLMEERFGDGFWFKGVLHAQGEDVGDRWDLIAEESSVRKVEIPPSGIKIKCPNCEEMFYYEEKKGDG